MSLFSPRSQFLALLCRHASRCRQRLATIPTKIPPRCEKSRSAPDPCRSCGGLLDDDDDNVELLVVGVGLKAFVLCSSYSPEIARNKPILRSNNMPNPPVAVSGAIVVLSVAVAVSPLHPLSVQLSTDRSRLRLPSTNLLRPVSLQKMSADASLSPSTP